MRMVNHFLIKMSQYEQSWQTIHSNFVEVVCLQMNRLTKYTNMLNTDTILDQPNSQQFI